MALFHVVRDSPYDLGETWRRLTSWERHADSVPLTRITVLTPAPNRVGTTFVARSGPAHSRWGRTRAGAAVLRWTGARRLGFDDPMEVTRWQPPSDGAAGLCRLDKRGGLVTGWAEIEVRPRATGARVLWREELRVRGLPRFLDPLLGAAARLVFGRAAGRLLRD
ncbi:SRPBCC family protein [Streptomyces sulfonofaciens]|nr:SRPBCC family protein [Streptomyces sulfonofaciens]